MTEAAIIRGCQKGKARYQKALVQRYAPMLLTVSRRYSRDEAFAEDILQEALIKIFKAIPQYKATGSFEAWLRKIVINTALQQLDKACFKREFPGLDQLGPMPTLPEIWGQLGAEELMELIKKLPHGFREVFNLFVIEGYSHKEIAKLLNIAESTSRSQLTRARKWLQKAFIELEKVRL